MIVTQPDRVILNLQVARYAYLLKGKLIDVGSGRSRRYKDVCKNVTEYLTLDRDPVWKPDILGSAESIPVPDNSIDSILCTQVLEHVAHPVKAMAEMFRVIKPGGVLLLTAPQTNELHEEPHDYFRYTSYGFRTLFEDAGFRVEVIDQRGKYFSMIWQIRIRHLINTWKPYERKWAMSILCPLSILLTRYAMWRDSTTKNPAAALHAIGWCVVGRKPE